MADKRTRADPAEKFFGPLTEGLKRASDGLLPSRPEFLLAPEELGRLLSELRKRPITRKRYEELHERLGKHRRAVDAAETYAGKDTNYRERILRTLGTPEEIEELIQHALSGCGGVYRLADSGLLEWSGAWECKEYRYGSIEDDLREMEKRLEQYGRLLEAAKAEAERHSLELEKQGWRFDSKERRLVRDGAPNKPKHALTEAVEGLCEHWKVYSNDQELRTGIALAFRGLYPRDQLDAARKGPIGNAVNSYFRRLSRSEIEARKAAATSKGRGGPGSPEP